MRDACLGWAVCERLGLGSAVGSMMGWVDFRVFFLGWVWGWARVLWSKALFLFLFLNTVWRGGDADDGNGLARCVSGFDFGGGMGMCKGGSFRIVGVFWWCREGVRRG
eukprot:TRINITY_DN20979_c0_g1_i1.p1 TRINITY_DN20979_c0_g1~~TRINITY_DN20979_c0_g1_i1.p1  ORF type:complete len:108 (+),score=13.44 TRINITY_DN20979_c0_g1_i1:90-413(+)